MPEKYLKKNDEVELYIEDFSSDGDGIGHIGENGYTLFVKDTVIGDRVLVSVMKTKKQYGFARLKKIISPSPDRIEPLCEHASRCGGCQLQHVSYECQLRYKENKIKNCLKRIGGFGEEVLARMEPVIGMEEPYFYRNKAQFPVGKDKDGKLAIGFYAGHSHQIIDCKRCYLQGMKMGKEESGKEADDIKRRKGDISFINTNEQVLSVVRGFLGEFKIEPYHEQTHTGLVRHILTRIGFYTREQMVCLVLNGKKLPHSEKLIERLKVIPGMKSICLNFNTEKTNVILGKKVEVLWGTPYITDSIGSIQYQISPLSFYQVNPVQTQKLYQTALDYAGLTGQEVVWDLYCGIGTISLFLAKRAKKVYGVEIVPQAVEDAKRNAELNQIENVEFFTGAAEEIVPGKVEEWKENGGKEEEAGQMEGNGVDVVVIDPPRKGCDPVLLDTIVKAAPKRIVYVSCDPATLARDLKVLCGAGYQVEKFRGCDMFGMGGHVETVVLMSRK